MHVTCQTTAWNNNLSCHQYEPRSKKLLRLKALLTPFIFMAKHLEKLQGENQDWIDILAIHADKIMKLKLSVWVRM